MTIDSIPVDLLEDVSQLAKDAGSFIRTELGKFSSDKIEVKDFNSLVSYVDIEAERMIVAGLQRLVPSAGFVTEESTVEQSQESDWRWIIDPLDGTTNFMHAIPFFAVSIALKHKEEYVIGVIYDVMHDKLFSARKGKGAHVNGKTLRVSPADQLSDSVLATGFPYNSFEWMERYLNLFRELFQSTRGVRRIGSAALDLCYVANGSFAGFYEYGLNEWDIAAGICIVNEAGGKVTDFYGGQEVNSTKTILASNAKLHEELLGLIDRHFIE